MAPIDPEAKLRQTSAGTMRLVARFRQVASLVTARDSVKTGGAFYLKVESEQPTTVDVEVLFRTARKGERFHATILAWNRGNVVLRPKLPDDAFNELTGSLLSALSHEIGSGAPASVALDETGSPDDVFTTSGSHAAVGERRSSRTPSDGHLIVESTPSSEWSSVEAAGEESETPPSAELDASPTAHDEEVEPTTEDGDEQTESTDTGDQAETSYVSESTPALPETEEAAMSSEPPSDSGDFEALLEETPKGDSGDDSKVEIQPPPQELDPTFPGDDRGISEEPGRSHEEEGWHKVRTGQTRVSPGVSPQARPGAFSPPDDTESGSTRAVSGFEEPHEVPEMIEPPSEGAAAPSQDQDLNSELMGAHAFLSHLERDEGNLVQGNHATGKEAISCVKQAAKWQPGAVLITSHLETNRLWYLFISGGKIVNAYRLPPTGTVALTPRLLSKGLITRDSAKRVLETARKYGLSEESALARHKLVDQETLTQAVVERVRNVTAEILAVENVRFKLYRLIRFPRQSRLGSTEVDTYRDLVGQLVQLSDEDMTAREAPHFEHYPTLKVRSDLLSQTLALGDEHELFISSFVAGDHRLLAAYSETTLDREEAFGVIFALEQMGLLVFRKTASHTSEASDDDSLSQREQSELTTLVESRVRYGNLMDPFEYLGLEWWAAGEEVDNAIARFEQALSPQKLTTASPDMEKAALAVLQAAREAYGTVRTEKMRHKRRQSLLGRDELKEALKLLEATNLVAAYRGDKGRAARILLQLEELDEDSAKAVRRMSCDATVRATGPLDE